MAVMDDNIGHIDLVVAHLKQIQNSDTFKGANRLQQFLGYVVEKYCKGSADEIKQYTIGVEAFSLNENFDPQKDPIIRIMAGKVRRRLNEYYSTEGVNDEMIIEIPKGSYVPLIVNRDTEDQKLTFSEHNGEGSSNTDTMLKKSDLTIAIVPFDNISGDQQLDYFGVGLSEEIASRLSLYKDFVIVPPIATRHLLITGSHFKLTDFAQEFNSRYVLDAIIRKAKDFVRLIVRLSDTSDVTQIWSGTYDTSIEAENLIKIQDEIATQVVNSIANEYDGVIPRKVSSESEGKEPVALSTYEAVLHIHHYNLSLYPAKIYRSTLEAVHKALLKAPKNADLLSACAELKIDGYTLKWADTNDLPVVECQELIDKALSHDKECAYAYYVRGLLETNRRRKKELLDAVQDLQMFKHSSPSLAQAGWFLAIAGEYEEGIELLDKHLGILRYYPGWFQHAYFLYHYEHERYEEALAHAKQFNMPDLLWDPIERAAALGQLGRLDDGRNAIQELLALYPDFFQDPRRYLNCYIIRDDLVDEVLNGLEKIGYSDSSDE